MRRGFVIIAAVVTAAVVAAAAFLPRGSSKRQSPAANVDELFAEWNRRDSPGCSVGVSRNGSVVHERAYGMASLELGVPITAASVFHVASIAKQFTAMSIMLLARRGLLSLDDEISKYIPEWADRTDRVTIRHLLTHTSGLRDAFTLVELEAPRGVDDRLVDSLVHVLAQQRAVNFPPGSQFQYNNGGYVTLAYLVKRLSGQSLREFADVNIFKPLGMTHTHVHDDRTMVVPDRASGYHRDETGFHVAPHEDLGRIVGTAGLLTTVRDLLIWEQNFVEPRVGDPGIVKAMETPATLSDGRTNPYGFGLEMIDDGGLRTVGHGGGDPGFAAYVVRYPGEDIAVAVLCNLDNIGYTVGNLARRVASVYLPRPSNAAATSAADASPSPVSLSPEQLARRVGLYRNVQQGNFGRLFIRDGKLRASPNAGTDGETFELTPVSATKFVIANIGVALEFLPTSPGDPQQARVTGDGPRPSVMTQILEPSPPSSGELRAFSGSYACPDLDVTYTIAARENDLVLQIPGRAAIPLAPIVRDVFHGSLVDVVRFDRDARGTVAGFTVTTSGVRRLPFKRVGP